MWLSLSTMNTTPHGNCENTGGLSAEGLIIQTFYWRLNLMAHNLSYDTMS